MTALPVLLLAQASRVSCFLPRSHSSVGEDKAKGKRVRALHPALSARKGETCRTVRQIPLKIPIQIPIQVPVADP